MRHEELPNSASVEVLQESPSISMQNMTFTFRERERELERDIERGRE